MALEFSPNGRGLLILVAVLLTLVIWMYTSGALLTLVVLAIGVAIITLLFWGFGTRLTRWIGGLN